MSDGISKHYVIYHDLLDEVERVVKHVDTLKDQIPRAADEVRNRLTPILGQIIAAGQEYQQVLDCQSEKFKRKVVAEVKTDVDVFKRELMNGLANDVSDLLEAPSTKMLKRLDNAVTVVETATSKAAANLWLVSIISSGTTAFLLKGIPWLWQYLVKG